MNIHISENVRFVMEALEAAGHEAYIVGGCVRDALMEKAPHDWDVCTSALPEQMQEVFADYKVIETGLKHGTLTVVIDSENIEITTFRCDGSYSDGRRPDFVSFTGKLSDDLSRRDFTMNAMAYNHHIGLIDLFDGQKAIEDKVIQCIDSPAVRFEEDALRILRAVRFQATSGFTIEQNTRDAMSAFSQKMIANVSRERIGSEFAKILAGNYAVMAIRNNLDIMCDVIPALKDTIGCTQNNKYHYLDVFDHTMEALRLAPQAETFPSADIYTRFAIFFHDIGKPRSKTTEPDGTDHFYAHAMYGATITEEVLRSLRYSNEFVDTVVQLVAYHDIDFALKKSCVRRMLLKLGEPQLRRIFKLRECDALAHTEKAHFLVDDAVRFSAILDTVLAEESAFSLKDLAIGGRDLVAIGMKQGPEIGKVLHDLLEKIINEELPNERAALMDEVRASHIPKE